MDIQSITLEGRAAAEATMDATCVVRRPGPDVTDPETGVVAPGLVPVYGADPEVPGICRVQSTDIGESKVVAGGHQFVLWDAKVYFPAGSGLQVDDVCEILTSPLNPDEVGKHYRIKERRVGNHKTSDRWNVELVVK